MSEDPRRALVVEDESAQRTMYLRALRSFGYEAEGVETGEAALAALEAAPAGVVLLDLNLGGEHGLDLFERIRERHPATSVVIATGYGSYELVRRALRLDVVDFLSKPVGLDELEAAIAHAWARHELVQAPVRALDGPDAPELEALVARCEDLHLETIEHAVILEALRRCDDNRKAAADALGISQRTLYYRLSQYRLRRGP